MADASPTADPEGDEASAAVPAALVASSDDSVASQPAMALLETAADEPRPCAPLQPCPLPSFEELYLSSYSSLVRLAFVLTGSIELSEDLVQDCFVRLHRHYDRLESPEHYAKQAVVNACKSHFRRSGRERDRRPLLYVLEPEAAAGPWATKPGELHDVLLTLPYRQRAAVVLRFYEDLSEAEIADVLGCRPGTVGSLIHRALARLRGVIER